MPAFSPFPDVEAIVSIALRAAGMRAYSSIPNSPTWPLIVVERVGGIAAERHRLDTANIQCNSWGNSKSSCRDYADQARLVICALEGTAVDSDGDDNPDAFVTGVDNVTGLLFLPDPVEKRDRYLFTVAVYAHTTE